MNFRVPSVGRVSWVVVLVVVVVVVVAVGARLPSPAAERARDPGAQVAGSRTATTWGCTLTPGQFLASIDTMKESMDTDTDPLTPTQIADDVNLAATLNTNYVTVDTHWDYPAYMQEWVDAVRNAGKHVWFRIHPNAWGGTNGVRARLTPNEYLTKETAFIKANPQLFEAGDILDMNPEPEDSPYWPKTYGQNWTSNIKAIKQYNKFFVAVSSTASKALASLGIKGVITTVRSTNSWFAENPSALFPSTVDYMQRVTIDSYPDENDTTPAAAVADRLNEVSAIELARPGVPIVLGEFGYSNTMNVDDALQASVVGAELQAIQSNPCIQGLNYWVGAGDAESGGYTHLFSGTTGAWKTRPAAQALSVYFAYEGAA
jgi:hypothetical protein